MPLNLKDIKLNSAVELEACEETLSTWQHMNKDLDQATSSWILALLAYELRTRRRLTVVQRLTARYGVLAQKEVEVEVVRTLNVATEENWCLGKVR